MITPFKSRWTGAHRAYSNNPERFNSIDGSVETWSRELTRTEDLPVAIADRMPELFQDFPYCVRTPALNEEPESFLFLDGPRVVIMRRTLENVSVFQSDLDAIDALETETTLLQSSLTFLPRTGEAQVVRFNTVVEDLFAPVVLAFLEVHGAGSEEAAGLRGVQPNPFDDLIARDYKYHAYATGILPDEAPLASFYHPTETVHGLFNGSRLIPSYLLVATGSMVYGFSEKAPFRDLDKTNYGLVVRYLPVNAGFALGDRALRGTSHYRMAVLKAGATAFEYPVSSANEAEFQAFAETLEVPAAATTWNRKVG